MRTQLSHAEGFLVMSAVLSDRVLWPSRLRERSHLTLRLLQVRQPVFDRGVLVRFLGIRTTSIANSGDSLELIRELGRMIALSYELGLLRAKRELGAQVSNAGNQACCSAEGLDWATEVRCIITTSYRTCPTELTSTASRLVSKLIGTVSLGDRRQHGVRVAWCHA
jgi:hypothetical protein